MAPPALPSRARLARFAAPAAFLAGVTVAVLLIRAGVSASDDTTTGATTTAAVTTTRPATTRTRTAARTTATQTEQRFYTIESGDTFGSIAAEFDTTVERLRELNPDVDPTQLTIGQRIRVA